MGVENKQKRIPRGLLDGLYDPNFSPEKLRLNEFIFDPEKRERDVKLAVDQQVEARKSQVAVARLLSEVPKPLSREEAEEVGRRVQNLKEQIATTKNKLVTLKSDIDNEAAPDNGDEIAFNINIKRRPRLKRALRKAFGIKAQTITYSMYRAALVAKKQLEDEDAEAYAEGAWNNNDEEG